MVSCTRPPLVTTSSTTRIFSPVSILNPRRNAKFPVLLFREDKPHTELPRDFLSDDESAERGRDDCDSAEFADFPGQRAPDLLDDGHLLERERALEVLAAVQTAAQNEMAFERRAGVAENLQASSCVMRDGM